jgi:hypothetical protein
MNELYHIAIFLIILFLYIQVTHQYKRSEDLEIYEMDYTTNTYLQEVCDLKQPVLFDYGSIQPDFFETLSLETLHGIPNSQDIKMREVADFYTDVENLDFIVLPIQTCMQLLTTDTRSAYFTEMNDDFITESGLSSLFRENDDMLKPTFTAQTTYDILLGSKGAITPLRYHTDYRRFICVNHGKLRVKMTPWKSHTYLYPVRDYENYDFRSPVHVWNTQPKYQHEMDKMKFLEFDVAAGHVLYLPPYWWYSIKFSDEPTLATGFTYNSIMNIVSNLQNHAMYFIQHQNIHTRPAKVLAISSNESKEGDDIEIEQELKTPLQQSIDVITTKLGGTAGSPLDP